MAGSSPLTRGAQSVPEDGFDLAGIIPAYAGSTTGGWHSHKRPRDHPRLRGEHEDFTLEPHSVRGSSPLTRGAPYVQGLFGYAHGIIPAYAGSTSRCASSGPPGRDHPRLRGEHLK